jgi:hypothetical protein
VLLKNGKKEIALLIHSIKQTHKTTLCQLKICETTFDDLVATLLTGHCQNCSFNVEYSGH